MKTMTQCKLAILIQMIRTTNDSKMKEVIPMGLDIVQTLMMIWHNNKNKRFRINCNNKSNPNKNLPKVL